MEATQLREVSPGMSLAPPSPAATVPSPEPKVSVCKQDFVHWPFKRSLDFQQTSVLPSHLDRQRIPCRFSRPDGTWDPLPSTSILDWGAWHGAETPCSSGGTSAAEISLQILNCRMWVWDQPLLHLCIPLVIGLLFS